ncbi:hypothetical protein N7478_000811 [Penicillium angulare]|uniref:uncharacterized protein n=1 Tax=Penicillium angulare TaxID=116970 RepID=UPI00253FA0D2|nr:uncharacterized protein N7478_000811 [Penicillium angulare]KAJ5291560.1 hypothetical protein N7478_000811 [Penicillium angulare]
MLLNLSPDKLKEYIRKPHYLDGDDGPEQVWRWSHAWSTPRQFISWPSQESLHGFGYVMWDRSRLEEWGLPMHKRHFRLSPKFFSKKAWKKEQKKKYRDELRTWKTKARNLDNAYEPGEMEFSEYKSSEDKYSGVNLQIMEHQRKEHP